MPTLTLPEMKLPEFDLQEIVRDRRDDLVDAAERVRDEMSHIERPNVERPRVELPKLNDIRRAAAREIDPGPSPLIPFVAGAAIVGLLVGWMLAMSPVTGPRIRSAVAGMRDRFDSWRSGSTDEIAERLDTLTTASSEPTQLPQSVASDPWTRAWQDEATPTPVGPGAMTASSEVGSERS